MLPGVAGVDPRWHLGSAQAALRSQSSTSTDARVGLGMEPMVDALVYEPIPYRSALEQGATHVLVLRSYPDGVFLPKSLLGLFELIIAPKCLDPYPATKAHLATAGHSVLYAQDIMRLNEAQRAPASARAPAPAAKAPGASGSILSRWRSQTSKGDAASREPPQMFGVSPLDVDGEVSQLTLDRLTLLRGIMQGFARLYDVFEPAPPSTVPGALNQGLKRLGDGAQGAASAVSGAVSGAGWSALSAVAGALEVVAGSHSVAAVAEAIRGREVKDESLVEDGDAGAAARATVAAEAAGAMGGGGDLKALEVFLPLHYEFSQALAARERERRAGTARKLPVRGRAGQAVAGTQTITLSTTYARQCQREWNRERDREAARQRAADLSARAERAGAGAGAAADVPGQAGEAILTIQRVGMAVPEQWQEGREYIMGGRAGAGGGGVVPEGFMRVARMVGLAESVGMEIWGEDRAFERGELVVIKRSSGVCTPAPCVCV